MSVYVEEALVATEGLREFGDRLLAKFGEEVPSRELLIDTEELEARIKRLIELLPEGISLGDWGRKVYFMKVWLKRNEPTQCPGDIAQLVQGDLPEAIRQVRQWGGSLSYFDEELRRAVVHLIRTRDFSSAIRAAFVVLTERLRKSSSFPPVSTVPLW
ncbi:MAG: hypothetical protein JO209_06820 [Acidisphaera sp.]|nr:hypothetical protein [Acidisphaera sp.]